jgi:hypothetical protein
MSRKPHPSDMRDEEWDFAAPYPALLDEQASQRRHTQHDVFNALCWLAWEGSATQISANRPHSGRSKIFS